MSNIYDVIVVGGGPAGLTAAIYCVRDNKSVLVIEKEILGGKITETPVVNNIPGFTEISGTEFGEKLSAQAESLGVEVEYDEVTSIKVTPESTVEVYCGTNTFYGKTCILATGTKNRTLGTPNEDCLIGAGIHFCVTCDGAFYKDKEVAVVGGGNSALTEALELSHIASKVIILQNLPMLTGEQSLIEDIENTPNIETVVNVEITKIARVEMDRIMITTKNNSRIFVDGVFEAIGLIPQNEAFKGIVSTDDRGFINCVNYENVFACGDCVHDSIQQVAVACGEGAKTAINLLRYLNKKH